MKITVVGSGAWGTALAISLCKKSHDVTLWARSADKAEQMKNTRQNPRLTGVQLPDELNISAMKLVKIFIVNIVKHLLVD